MRLQSSRSRETTGFKICKQSELKWCSGILLLHGRNYSLPEPDAQCQRWKQWFRWFIYHWNAGTWRVWLSLSWINRGNGLIPPTMNLGSLCHIHGKGIYNHRTININRPHMYHDDCENAWNSCLGIVLCADDEVCHIENKGLLLHQISCFPAFCATQCSPASYESFYK